MKVETNPELLKFSYINKLSEVKLRTYTSN